MIIGVTQLPGNAGILPACPQRWQRFQLRNSYDYVIMTVVYTSIYRDGRFKTYNELATFVVLVQVFWRSKTWCNLRLGALVLVIYRALCPLSHKSTRLKA